MTASGASSRSVAERYGFDFCTGDEKDILENGDINTVFIATRHDSHAEFVLKALKAGKHVFVEKPLCLTEEELGQIAGLMTAVQPDNSSSGNTIQPLGDLINRPSLMVGYNGRFAPLVQLLKEKVGDGPMSMLYRINAGHIPPDFWIQDIEFGGGRIIGEVCHFVDFLTFINGSLPVLVYAAAMNNPNNLNDVLNISLPYENGSIGTISYFADGDKSLPKERVEIYANGSTVVLDDFKTLAIHSHGKKKKKILSQNKGQKTEVKQFIEAILNGTGEVIPFVEIYSASFVTFKIIESIRTIECLRI
jgi:predicted dehydrogenase